MIGKSCSRNWSRAVAQRVTWCPDSTCWAYMLSTVDGDMGIGGGVAVEALSRAFKVVADSIDDILFDPCVAKVVDCIGEGLVDKSLEILEDGMSFSCRGSARIVEDVMKTLDSAVDVVEC